MVTSIESDIAALEHEYWRAIKDGDVDAAIRLTNDPCMVAGSQGVARIDKAAFARMLFDGSWKLHDFALSDIAVEKIGDDVAIIGYTVREEMTVDGKPLTLRAADASTWVRRDGNWVCVMHTESILGDPFGRDRTAD